MTDRETIESMLYELATPQNMGSFFVKNATSDFLLIRPSGNPITAKGFEEMMSSGDVVQEKAEITKIHKFEFLAADVAMCVFTLGAKFSYKGTPNDDLPTVTSIFKKINGIWKIHWMQRSTGDSDLSLWDQQVINSQNIYGITYAVVSLLLLGSFAYLTFKMTSKNKTIITSNKTLIKHFLKELSKEQNYYYQ